MRTGIAGEIVETMKDTKHQIFALIVWRIHNTEEAWKEWKGSLMNSMEDEDVEKKRGRKNKYYLAIDKEDDEEANQISDDSENDGLDHDKEEDDEDEEDELVKKRKADEE